MVLYVLIYLGIFNLSSFSIVFFFYFHICRLVKIVYKLTMLMYCPNRSVSASYDHLCLILFLILQDYVSA